MKLKKTWVGVRSEMMKKMMISLLPTHPQMKKKMMMKMMRMLSDGYGRPSPFWCLMPKGE
jgi:hypothetical protein